MFGRKPKKLYTTEEGKLPKGYRHGDIIAGYLPCTIPDAKHDGPCALPSAYSARDDLHIRDSVEVRTYGFDGTIHQTTQLDVETDKYGVVVAVWFRCQALPFKQRITNDQRSAEMTQMYAQSDMPSLLAVEVRDA